MWRLHAGLALVGCLILAAFGFPAGASAAGAGGQPAGGISISLPTYVKLPPNGLRYVHGFACGNVGGQWASGTVLPAGYFVSNHQMAIWLRQVRIHTTGPRGVAVSREAQRYRWLAGHEDWRCHIVVRIRPVPIQTDLIGQQVSVQLHATDNDQGKLTFSARNLPPGLTLNAATGLVTGTPRLRTNRTVRFTATDQLSGHSATKTTAWFVRSPLHFRIAHATGLVLTGTSVPSGTHTNLEAVGPNGRLWTALDHGYVDVNSFYIAPNNQLYLAFSSPVDLAHSPYDPSPTHGCWLAEVDRASGHATCVDPGLVGAGWGALGGLSNQFPIQFDNSGAMYYDAVASSGAVLRKRFGGQVKTLATGDVTPRFRVAPDGTVIAGGQTGATESNWTRVISPTDQVTQLNSEMPEFVATFPDGNVYMGYWPQDALVDDGVMRYLSASQELDPKYWIGYLNDPSKDYFSEQSPLCAGVTQAEADAFCSFDGAFVSWTFASAAGGEYVLADGSRNTVLMQYYPTVRFLPTEVANVTVAKGFGNDLLLAGSTSGSDQVLTLYDTSTDTEQELLGGTNQVAIYHLGYNAGTHTVLFDGLRFSDNQYVLGEYDLDTHSVSFQPLSGPGLADLQTFGANPTR